MSYTMRYQVFEAGSSKPLLSKEADVDGDTALKFYSQIIHETPGAEIVPKTLADMFPHPEPELQPLVDKCELEQEEQDREMLQEQTVRIDSQGKVLKIWDPEEREFLRGFATVNDALEGFCKEYPESDRTDKSVNGAWYILKKKGLLMCQAKPAIEEAVEEAEPESSPAFRLNDYVKVIDKNLPSYGKTGKVLSVRKNEALVSIQKCRYWIAHNKLELQENPSKN
ncbi:MAG: hypothetical protein JXQ82_07830 [Methanomicrobiaceae archaeon]|nr:hypothetical protein [Methanomicrobiaceae archaeon]